VATVRFYLRSPKLEDGKLRKDEVSIFAKFTVDRNRRIEITLDEKIEPKHWDFKSQQVKSTYRGHYEVNIYLSDFKTKLLTLYRENRDIPFDKFKALAQQKPSTEKKTLFIAIEQFLAQYGAEKDIKTVGRYKVMTKQLKIFSQTHDIDIHTLDHNFYDKFKRFLFEIPNPNYRGCSLVVDHSDTNTFSIDRSGSGTPIGLFDDTVYKYFIHIKTFLAWAEKRGFKVHPSYKSWEIIQRRYPPISLTLSEVEHLENFEFTEENVKPYANKNFNSVIKAINIARDYLVFECRTGQRISDIKRFDLKDFKDDKWTFTPRKGNRLLGKTNTVYFKGYCAPALLILQKHNWKMPVVSEQKINDNIKTACKIAGINEEITTYRWAQNKRIKISGPKYSFLSSHTGRKSFVTILLQHTDAKTVKDLAGIDSWETLKHYEGNSESSAIESNLEKIPTRTVMKKAL
jgi:site-specific recombinase XerD